MSSTAASGFVFLLLSVKVIQSQDGLGVIYIPNLVCGVIGSKVDIICRYEYPSTVKEDDIRDRFWYSRNKFGQFLPIRANPHFSGRVREECHNQRCNLTISNLRKSDAAQFQFRFTTTNNAYTGKPGVTLAVTDPGFKVLVSKVQPNWVELDCRSSYPKSTELRFIWYRNGKKYAEVTSLLASFGSSNSYSCSQKGQEERCSPPVYAPKRPSVSVRPSNEIMEGSSVTLTCSSDANPAANYTWYTKNHTLHTKGPELVISSIQSSDSGQYYCEGVNLLGTQITKPMFINVKYPPKLPSVSVSPSDEIIEGSSVTLTCSSDANPAANYTWYKGDEDSPKSSARIFTITNFRAEHTGKYSCEAKNTIGRSNSTFHLSLAAGPDTTLIMLNTIRWTLVVLMLIYLLLLFLWLRKKKVLNSTTELDEPTDESDDHSLSEDMSDEEEDSEEHKTRCEDAVTPEGDSLDGN